jgi:hypothetical protein
VCDPYLSAALGLKRRERERERESSFDPAAPSPTPTNHPNRRPLDAKIQTQFALFQLIQPKPNFEFTKMFLEEKWRGEEQVLKDQRAASLSAGRSLNCPALIATQPGLIGDESWWLSTPRLLPE